MRHVVWDWNGTLFDDLHVIVDAVNTSLARFDAGPIDADGYRASFTRPVSVFYERLLGKELSVDEWRTIDTTFHDAYREALGLATLAGDAWDAIVAATDAGATQSLLSMWFHDELLAKVAEFGLDEHMLVVDGLRNGGESGESKVRHLRAHLDRLASVVGPGIAPAEVLVIGDIADDARAAAAVGAACVLYDGGSVRRDQLQAQGVPVADSLLDALVAGGVL